MATDRNKILTPTRPRVPELDSDNVSRNPSYSQIKIPYSKVCEQRLKTKAQREVDEFRKELEELAHQHCHAFSGIQLMHLFDESRPMNKRIKDPLTPKERDRLEYLLRNEIN